MKQRMRPAVCVRATARAIGSGQTAGRIKLWQCNDAIRPSGTCISGTTHQPMRYVEWDQTELQEGLQAIIADLQIAFEGMNSLQSRCEDPMLREWLPRKCEQVSEMCLALDMMKTTQPDSSYDPGHNPDNGILSSKR